MQALYDISAFGLLPLGASIMQSPRENASPCVKLDPIMHIPIGGRTCNARSFCKYIILYGHAHCTLLTSRLLLYQCPQLWWRNIYERLTQGAEVGEGWDSMVRYGGTNILSQ